ncbi:LysM peptidoglycan-binding domain-containing protein [Litchfieldia salsa]|uniref:LysM domain-containing protein n=1 Tax=Litchfieldia salsa TaxID=930152 RepID=A0A1H0WG04_9BACI|nr:LysM peptidoglycan-binding domain-containing protein [Litchfieldia salsa]SDP89587.1 LysM domain-containing protein [Litchfieldia salsa]
MNHQEEDILEKVEGETLPPRSKVHKNSKKNTKLKIKFPVVRLLSLFFILLVLTIISTTIYYKDSISLPIIVEEDNQIYEKINYANKEPLQIKTKNEIIDKEIEDEPLVSNNDEITTDENTTTEVKNNDLAVQRKQQEPKNEYEIKYHTVNSSETLYRISNIYYQSRDGEQLIKEWNGLKGNRIYEGQVLKIPIKIENTK